MSRPSLSRWVWMMPAANRKKLSEYGAIELDNKQPATITLRSLCEEPLPLQVLVEQHLIS